MKFTRIILFCAGWLTGGGVASLIFTALLEKVGLMPANPWFAFGTAWGTFGTFVGLWMYRTGLEPRKGVSHE